MLADNLRHGLSLVTVIIQPSPWVDHSDGLACARSALPVAVRLDERQEARYTSAKSDASPSDTRIVLGTLPVVSSMRLWHCISVTAAVGSAKHAAVSYTHLRAHETRHDL